MKYIISVLSFLIFVIVSHAQTKITPSGYTYNTSPDGGYPDNGIPNKLIDGTIANCTWGQGCTVNSGQFVGWQSGNPSITFNFSSTVEIAAVKIWLADSDGSSGVILPSSAVIDPSGINQTTNISNQSGSSVIGVNVAFNTKIIGRSITVVLNRVNTWTMLTEIEFFTESATWAGSWRFNNNDAYANSDNLSGTGSLTKSGTGLLTLSGNNSFSGGITINGNSSTNNILKSGSSTAFGTGTVNVNGENNSNGSMLDVNGQTLSNEINIKRLNTGNPSSVGALFNSNTSSIATLSGGLTIGGENYTGGDGHIIFNGIVSGGVSNSYSFYKQGAGTWTFNNTVNTFDGFYFLVNGTTEIASLANINNASSLGRPTTTTANKFIFTGNGGILRYIGSTASASDRAFQLSGTLNEIDVSGTSDAATLNLTGAITGVGALKKSGSRNLILSGANTYSGGTTISAGRLISGHGNIPGSVTNNAELEFNLSSAGIFGGAISGTGAVFKTGSEALTLSGTNTFTGGTTIQAGTVTLGNNSALGTGSLTFSGTGLTLGINADKSITNNLVLSSNATLSSGSSSFTVSGIVSGSGTLSKTGSGTLTLSGNNTYSGGTSISDGNITLGHNNGLGTGDLSFAASGLTLGFNGGRTIPNNLILNNNAAIATGSNAVTINGNITGTGKLTKTGSGTLTLGGNNSFSGGFDIAGSAGQNSIIKASSSNAFGTGTISVLGGPGATGSTLDLNGQTLTNDISILNKNSGVNDEGAIINTNTSTPAILNGTVAIGGEIYAGGNGDIIFNSLVSGGLNNIYSIYKRGSGTWRFTNNANTFDGFFYLIGGAVEVTSLANNGTASSLGQVSASQNYLKFGFGSNGGGTLRFVGSTSNSSNRIFEILGSTATTNKIEANGSNINATLTLTGNLFPASTGTFNFALGGANAGANIHSGIISNGSGTLSLIKEGIGNWTLSGQNTYTGGTTISSGRLISGHSNIPGVVTNNSELEFNQSTAGTFGSNISGTGALFKTGTGSLTLTGTNSYSGGTTIFSGRLIGNTTSLTGSFSNLSQLEINQTTTASTNITVSGSGELIKSGAGTLTLNGSSSHSGGTSLTSGSLTLGHDNALGTGALTFATPGLTLGVSGNRSIANNLVLSNNATLATSSNSFTISGNITGTGKLTKTGTGTLTLGGNNTFSGGFEISGGSGQNSIIKASSSQAFGTGLVSILGGPATTGSTLDLNGQSLTNDISILNKNSGVNDEGAIINTNITTPATLNGTVTIGGEIYAGGDGDINFNSLVSGGLNNIYSIYKRGSGTWRFANDANIFDGFFYLIGGAVEVTSLANNGSASSLGQVSSSQNYLKFGFGSSGGGILRFVGTTASTSNRIFEILGSTTTTNKIEASGASSSATLTLNGNLSPARSGSFSFSLGGTNTGANTYSGIISNGSGTLSLVKEGAGFWKLTGANTYTGSTIISAGELMVTNTLTSSSGVSVSSGATLSGTGTLPSTTVSGTHAPGTSPGLQTVSGNLTYAGGSSINMEFVSNAIGTRGTDHDAIDVTGDLTFNATTALNLAFNATGSAVDWTDAFWRYSRTGGNGWKLFEVSGNVTGLSNVTLTLPSAALDKNGITLSSARNGSTVAFALVQVGTGVYLTYTVTSNTITWTGTTNSSWGTTTNWSPNGTPAVENSVVIGTSSNPPTFTGTATYRQLTVNSGAFLNLAASSIMRIYGDLTANSTVSGDGTLELNGTTAQTITGTGTVHHLKINNSSGGVTIATGSNKLYVTGVLTPTSGVLTTNGNLVFRSTATAEGTVGTPGTCPTEPISGDVTVEKYIPGRRAFRLLTPGVTTSTPIKAHWQEGGSVSVTTGYPYPTIGAENPAPGYGTHITGTGGSANGFDASFTNNASLFTYDPSATAWVAEANTNGATNILRSGEGYRILMRGSRAVDLNNNAATADATTLRTTGTLEVCATRTFTTSSTVPLSGASAGFSLVGNPYWSVVDWHAVTKSNLEETMYYWDPTLSGTGNRGAYVSYNTTTGSSNVSSSVNSYIQPGQAFFVRNTAGVNGSTTLPSLSITKDHIVTGTGNRTTIFGRAPGSEPVPGMQLTVSAGIERIYVSLLSKGRPASSAADGLLIAYGATFGNDHGREDAVKMTNPDENLSAEYGGRSHSILGLSSATDWRTDSIPLRLWNLSSGEYALKFDLRSTDPARELWVYDKTTRRTVQVTKDGFVYGLTVAAGETLKNGLVLVVHARSPRTWAGEAAGLVLYPNPLWSDRLQLAVSVGEALRTGSEATVEVLSLQGSVVQRGQVLLDGLGRGAVDLPGLLAGTYVVRVRTMDGRVFTSKMIRQ